MKQAKIKPEIGDKIYVDTSLYLSHGMDDFHGGLATVIEVRKGVSGGEDVWFVRIKERPHYSYNWCQFLRENQQRLATRFGSIEARPIPDYREEFNRWD